MLTHDITVGCEYDSDLIYQKALGTAPSSKLLTDKSLKINLHNHLVPVTATIIIAI